MLIKPPVQYSDEMLIVFNDTQLKRQCDEEALGAALSFIEEYAPKITHFVFNGDISDYEQQTHYAKFPDSFARAKEEIDATKWLFETITNLLPHAEKIFVDGNHECFDEKTQILTDKGWINYSEITPNTIVASYNTLLNKIEWDKPLKIHQYDYSGVLKRIQNKHTDLFITPNHRLYYNLAHTKDWKIQELSKIHVGNNRVTIKCAGTEQNGEYPILDNELKLIAWVMTDGWVEHQYKYIRFSQRESKYKMITTILDDLGYKYSISKRNRHIQSIDGKVLLKEPENEITIRLLSPYHKKINTLLPNKHHLPDWINRLSDRQFEIFLQAFIDGDGSRHKNRPNTSLMIYGTKSIIEQLQTACFLHGLRTTIAEYRPGDYRLNITKNTTTCFDGFQNYIKEEQYVGIVWCVTTKNDTVIVKRNGKIAITGNSRWENMIKDQTMGLEEWIKTPDEMFHFKELGWQHIGYGRGKYYRWHDRIFWHGARAGSKSNIPKQELDDAGVSVTTAHINRNMFHEYQDVFGNYKSAYTHGGFSRDNLSYMKKAATGWTQGFGIYFWNEEVGEQVFPIIMRHGQPHFLYNGKIFNGKGFKIP